MPDNAPSHPLDETLSAFGLGKLDDRSAESVEQHLDQCPDCQLRVAEMSSDDFLDRLRDAQEPTGARIGETIAPGPGAPLRETTTQCPDLPGHPDYTIVRELGHGGMGVVYLAHNHLMGRDEVLKVVRPQLLDRKGVLERFLREIRAAAKLHHPNIVSAYTAFRSGESTVFAMEYVVGLDLARLVATKGPLPVAHACNFVYQVALGLQHAHEHGLVHRDIKPANLMLTRTGTRAVVKVLDFGLAKATREQPIDGGLTREGQMLGTPDCIAPEQIRDAQSADIRADIYSLGCTLYYLLSGGPPFEAENLWDLYQAHFSRDADPLNLIRPEVPSELAALVAKMMAKEPARRFQTPAEVAQALTPFFKPGPAETVAPPTLPDRPPRRPSRLRSWIVAAGGFVLVLLLGIIIHITIGPGRASIEVERSPEVKRPSPGRAVDRDSSVGRAERRDRALVPKSPSPATDEQNPWPGAQELAGLAFPPAHGSIIAMSQDGRLLAQHRADQPLRIRNSSDASHPRECGPPVPLNGAKFSPSGKYLASYGNHKQIWLWDTGGGNNERQIVVDAEGRSWHTEDVAFSPDESRLAAVIFQYRQIRIFDTTVGRLEQTLRGHANNPWCVAFSPDGTRLVSGGGVRSEKAQSQGELKLWSVEGSTCLNLAGHAVRTQSVSFSPDGRSILSSGTDRTARVWDVKTLRCITTFDKHPAAVVRASFSPDGRLVASISKEKVVRVWETATGRELATLGGLPEAPGLVVFSPRGRWIFAASAHILKAWECPSAD